jgi:ribonuclease HI
MLQQSDYDFFLFTDGSGHQDGYGGWASLIISPKWNVAEARMAACKGTTVERAEFEALLLGLQSILEKLKLENAAGYARLERTPMRVFWLSDRESLVLSVKKNPDGSTVYRRKASPDLWARFAWYEKYFDVTPRHAKRESNPHHNLVDRLASDARVLVKDYMELPDNSIDLLLQQATDELMRSAHKTAA